MVLRHPAGGSNSLPAQLATVLSGHTEIEVARVRASPQAGTPGARLLPLAFLLACLVPMWITARQRPRQYGFLGSRVDSGSRPGISPRLVHHQRRDVAVPPSSHPPVETGRLVMHHPPRAQPSWASRLCAQSAPRATDPTVAALLLRARTQLGSRFVASRRSRIGKVSKVPSSLEIDL
jgi:hypothetical protein